MGQSLLRLWSMASKNRPYQDLHKSWCKSKTKSTATQNRKARFGPQRYAKTAENKSRRLERYMKRFPKWTAVPGTPRIKARKGLGRVVRGVYELI